MEQILILLIVSLASISGTGSWICGADFCTEGEEFCRPDKRTGEDICFRCDHFESSCFVRDKHENNCTTSCKDAMEKRLREKDCSEPPDILNGNYSRTKTKYDQGTEVDYTCKDGYSIQGRKHISCKQFGQWSDPPACEAVRCPVPKTPKNGQVFIGSSYPVSERKSLPLGETVKYTCDAGHKLIGESHGYCTNEGQLDHQPPVCIAENSETTFLIPFIAVFFLLVVSMAINIRSCCKKRKQSKEHKRAQKSTFPSQMVTNHLSGGEQGQALLPHTIHTTTDTTDPAAGMNSKTTCNDVIYENEQTPRAKLGAVPSTTSANSSTVENTATFNNSSNINNNNNNNNNNNVNSNNTNNSSNDLTNGSIPGGNDHAGGINNTNMNNNGSHGNHSDSISSISSNNNNNNNTNNNVNSVGNQTFNIHLHMPGVNHQSNPDQTANEPEPTGAGIQEEGEDETTTKFSDQQVPVQPLAPREQPRPSELCQPHANDEGEKAIGNDSAELLLGGRDLSKRLSNHQQEQQQGPAKMTVASGEADHQDFGN